MKDLGYILAKIKYRLLNKDKEIITSFFRKNGMRIGSNCNICCNIMTTEPFLIKIGDNVTISADVLFVTHDNSISKILTTKTDIFGEIVVGDNCFIGARATILYGVTLCDNVIVAAGSVVTRSFGEPNIIIAGNPAKKIGTWSNFGNKYSNIALNLNEILSKDKEAAITNHLVSRKN